MVRQLSGGEFTLSADNVVLIGGPGTGKTHIATALGVQAIEHHHDPVLYRQRHKIEIMFGRLKDWRRIHTL
jgi:DNA replication protein DnaC